MSTQTRHIATVATTDSIDTPSSRTHIETILDQVNESLRECFTVLEDVENATASKQNILTDLHRELTNIIHKCAPCDDVITRQLLVAFFELSVELDRDHTEVIDTLFEAGNNKEEIKRQIKSLRRESVSPELTAVNVSAEDVNLILESIQNKGQDK